MVIILPLWFAYICLCCLCLQADAAVAKAKAKAIARMHDLFFEDARGHLQRQHTEGNSKKKREIPISDQF